MGWRRNGSLGGGSGEECVVTSLVPLGTAVALFERGSNNGLSKAQPQRKAFASILPRGKINLKYFV